jgi:hypothetical protein
MDEMFDEKNERIQRLLNEAKKQDLEEKYDAHFGSSDSSLSPEAESAWLQYIEEFERQTSQAKQITVREYVGNPMFSKYSTLSLEQRSEAVQAVFDLLNEHQINVDFLAEVPEDEVYRFLTEELMDHEIDDIRIEGMFTNFIYEEFHPNFEMDAKQFAEEFLFELFGRKCEYAVNVCSKDELLDLHGKKISLNQMQERILALYSRFSLFLHAQHNVIGCIINEDRAEVRFHSQWNAIDAVTLQQVSSSGETVIIMKRSPYGGCDVVQANIVGIEL